MTKTYDEVLGELKVLAESIGAELSPSCSGELVMYTGLAVNPKGHAVKWCEECQSGDDVPVGGCDFCDRDLSAATPAVGH